MLKAKRSGNVTVKASVAGKKLSQKVKIKGKKKIAIDAGHQTKANTALEPIGPGAKTKKMKVTGGCVGVATHIPEYQFTLRVAKKLKKELMNRGYEVYMVRTKNNVNISNMERALKTNNSGSDIYIRIHGDSNTSQSLKGASGLYPSKSNPYVGNISAASYKLTKKIMAAYCKKTGIKNRGCIVRNDLTGTNWSKIPVTLIECGFMSNPAEDKKLQNAAFQKKIAAGMADGIDDYFGF
ncbi:MAG: N-acetylmuramoyl-L-alanine amidase [Lachnospiraceae bacterium]|nr:N-acetylmuramoyl-L-alanine amidase [Lachnospiraceae bacterium]